MNVKQFGLLILVLVVGSVVVKCATTDRCQEAKQEVKEWSRKREIAVAAANFDKAKEAYDQLEYWNQKEIDACY